MGAVLSAFGLFSTGYVANDAAAWWSRDDGSPLENLETTSVSPVAFAIVGVVAVAGGLYINKKLNGK